MPIDWFTVTAQAVNFLILVWLLKRFLFKPILHAIDEREKVIANRLAEAETKKAEAQKEREGFQHKNEAFDQDRAALLKKASDDAAAERQRLLDQARKDAEKLRANRQDALLNEQRTLNQEINRWTQKEVFDVARKTLADLATTSLEERIGDAFVIRLRALTGATKDKLATALKTSTDPARIRSAFDLPQAQRTAIETAVKETFAVDPHVEFETSPDLVSGVELSTNGQKVAWSIADYLVTLEKSVGELLQKDAKPESKPEAKSTPEPAAKTKPGPKPEPNAGLQPTPSTSKADH